ncbi:dual oxidase 1-like [Physella acuta]|uniref:dual oxidase 1-like n=1 Tax=Physella acuta TaxID=109671 RepID=UPI0027DE406D|nr:dual oxidase 1-like [Physella acuta]XP_059143774.1 dual oxidase 1-like [Physella acuta]XP_059143782.1 dual oxidase 1-like [Physella acuta]
MTVHHCMYIGALCVYLVLGQREVPVQRFDGWYNNPLNPSWGGVGRPLERNITPTYEDETYQLSGWDRPNPRRISNELFGNIAGESGIPNQKDLTALFAFFGRLVEYEILDTDDVTCPMELVNTPVPRGDPDFDPDSTGRESIPYERKAYDKNTGQSPNNPRRQLNGASSYIDGSFIYGNNVVRTEFLRQPNSGKLACEDKWGKFPLRNEVNLKYHPLTYSHNTAPDLWRLGDPHVFENPALLALSVMFYRYHNKVVDKILEHRANLTNDEVFEQARRRVIATMQKIIVYDWLPKLIGHSLPPYTGYKSSMKSDITDIFDAGAINYIMTLIPAGINQLDKKCSIRKEGKHKGKRLCRTYWKAMEAVYEEEDSVNDILKGLAAQWAEKADTYVVQDYRSYFYGTAYHTSNDAVLQAIMKGRDYGLPDYNTVRLTMGLPVKNSFEEINTQLNESNPQLMETFKRIHMNDLSKVDMFVGGMMETTDEGPGELFTLILYDQFIRIRDGDRFWFENKDNGLFSSEEIAEIQSITLHDIIYNVTQIEDKFLQKDVFLVSNDTCAEPQTFNESQLAPCPKNTDRDYFKGSEIAYIIIWTCIGLLPLLCILTAFILAKCKRWQHQKHLNSMKIEKEKKRILRRTISCSVSVHDALEWRGCDVEPRSVELHLTNKGCLEIFATSGMHIRSIKISYLSTVAIKMSSNKKRNVLAIIMPREYDLVVEFPSEPMRNEFCTVLCTFAQTHNVDFSVIELRLRDLYNAATTKEKRNKMLEKFFKTVFSEAFNMDYNPNFDTIQLDMRKYSQEIMEVELSKEEFAEAMAIKPNSLFVEHFFSLIDSDRNGYISFREFLNAVVLFSKGSINEKLQTMFYMYDIDGTGYMSQKQIGQMFRSLLELAQSNLDYEDVNLLVESLCSQSGMEPKEKYTFEDFVHLLSPEMNKLSHSSFDWKGLSNVLPKSPKKSSDSDMRKRGSMASLSGLENGGGSKLVKKFEAVRETYTPVKAKMKLVKHFIENYRQHIFFLILFYGVCVGLFAERFYYYTVEQEHSGFRKLMSYGISFTRGAAAAMSFTFSFLLLTMCRNTITYLRSTALNLFIPFDSHISFHKVVAWTALFFSAIHVIGYSFNFYHLVSQPTKYLCIFTSLVFRNEIPLTFQEWVFGTMPGFTGVLLVLVLCVLYTFATQIARRHIFTLFWMTHKLFIALYVLTIIHGATVVVQKPMFFAYLTGPAILFTLDKLISLSRKKTEICILKAQNLPSDVTMIEFKRPPRFEYKSGQWVRIACLAQGKDEYHPFTLTSAPHEDTLKLHIRALGPWTWNLRHIFDDDKSSKNYPKLYLDGPYGAGQQDWYQYDVSVLVGAGIGVTPYASILKDFVHMSSINMRYKVKCQKLYFIWITGSQRHFEWLIDILREVEEIDTEGMVSIDIFITQFFQNFDLRTSLLYIFEEHFQKMNGGRSVFTGLKATTHFGRPQMNKIMDAVHRAHPQTRKVGVFSCGPPGVTKGVERACVDTSKVTKAMFEHHFENF